MTELDTLEALLSDTAPPSDAEATRTVVRLTRSFWCDPAGAYQRLSIRYLKRQCRGFNIFAEDCSMIGADDVMPRITNLEQCKDGVYELVTCNEHRDYESGHVEEWDYKLAPIASGPTQ